MLILWSRSWPCCPWIPMSSLTLTSLLLTLTSLWLDSFCCAMPKDCQRLLTAELYGCGWGHGRWCQTNICTQGYYALIVAMHSKMSPKSPSAPVQPSPEVQRSRIQPQWWSVGHLGSETANTFLAGMPGGK